jgi:putative membrane protein
VVRILVSWAANALVLALTAWLFSGVGYDGTGSLLFAAAVFGILNTVLKPLAKLLTLPLAILTLGLAWFFVSMLMLWLTDVVVGGFDVEGFWTFVGATIVIWLLNLALDALLGTWRDEGRST